MMYLELIPHPESKVEALALEELLRSLHGHGEALVYIVEYDGVHLKFLLGVPERLASSVAKSLQGVYGKLAVREAGEPDLKRYGWVAELRLRKPFYHVLVTHRRDSPLDLNPMDVLASTITGSPCATRIVAAPAPEEARVAIGEYTYAAKQGIPESTVEAVLRDLASFDESGDVRVCKPPEEEIREAELKMRSTLWTCRIQVFAGDPETARRVASAFNQFPGNQFTFRVRRARPEDYEVSIPKISRFLGLWVDKKAVVLSERELALFINLPSSFHHLPVRHSSLMLEPPPELAKLGVEEKHLGVKDLRELAGKGIVLLGFYGGKGYGLDLEEFMRSHKAIFGTTGAGKSSFARYVMLSLLEAYGPGRISLVYFDPNGDDSLKLVKLLPEEFVDHLVYIDPRTGELYGRCVKLNFLEYRDPRERAYLVEAFIGAIASYFGKFWGPRTEHFMRMAVKLVTAAPPGEFSLLDVYRVFTDGEVRARFLDHCDDLEVQHFWQDQYPVMVKKAPESVQSVLNKLGKFVNDPLIRPFVTARRSTVDLKAALDEGKIVVVNMGSLKGTETMNFFGAMLLGQFMVAAFSRGLKGEASRKPAFIFVDELHNFVSPMLAKIIAQMMAETRKFNVFLAAMTQYPQQLPRILRAALYELARQIIVFQCGQETAKELKKLFEPYLAEEDLINMDSYHYAARFKLGAKTLKPFTLKAPYIPVSLEGSNVYLDDPLVRERIERSLELYGAPVREASRAGPSVSPGALRLAYAVHRRGGRASVQEVLEELGCSLAVLATLVEEAARAGLVKEERGALVATEKARELFDASTEHGGGWHREAIKSVAEDLMERGCYVVVDRAGGEDRPDIVAYEPVDSHSWRGEPLCVEVEADPPRHLTLDKLAQIVKRCYQAGCGSIKIVVPSEDHVALVEERLSELRGKARRISIAVGVPRTYIESVDVEVEALPLKGREKEELGIHDLLRDLMERGLAGRSRDGKYVYLTKEALQELGLPEEALEKLGAVKVKAKVRGRTLSTYKVDSAKLLGALRAKVE